MNILRSNQRGNANHGWLKSMHTFSFADYYNPDYMGFKSLRVINEDRIAGGTGFGAHPHRDMEIISYVMSGALKHEDSMGNVAIIKPGEVQRMSAGTGVVHAENNPNEKEEAHFFQIWITPQARGGTPGYGQKSFEEDLKTKKMVLVVSQDGRDGSIPIKQDADLYISRLPQGESVDFQIRHLRGVWLQVVKGEVNVNGQKLVAGDAVSLSDEDKLTATGLTDSEFMLFDLV